MSRPTVTSSNVLAVEVGDLVARTNDCVEFEFFFVLEVEIIDAEKSLEFIYSDLGSSATIESALSIGVEDALRNNIRSYDWKSLLLSLPSFTTILQTDLQEAFWKSATRVRSFEITKILIDEDLGAVIQQYAENDYANETHVESLLW